MVLTSQTEATQVLTVLPQVAVVVEVHGPVQQVRQAALVAAAVETITFLAVVDTQAKDIAVALVTV